MGVGKSTMSITVSRLGRAGYIASSRDKRDARCVSLTLRPAGVRAKEENTVLDAELIKKMFQRMPAMELEAALKGIECMAKYAKLLLRERTRGHER